MKKITIGAVAVAAAAAAIGVMPLQIL